MRERTMSDSDRATGAQPVVGDDVEGHIRTYPSARDGQPQRRRPAQVDPIEVEGHGRFGMFLDDEHPVSDRTPQRPAPTGGGGTGHLT